jgi:DNA-binding NtrC family response regulator
VGGAPPPPAAFVPRSLRDVELDHILATLDHTGGNKTQAARLLGISRQTLRDKLRQADERER